MHALFSGYTVMIGSFDPAVFEDAGIDYFGATEARILFFMFTFFINIVMLNLLITYMGHIFEGVQKSVSAEFMYGRASICVEYESLISPKDKKARKDWFPKWLQVLQPSVEVDQSADKEGRKREEKEKWNNLDFNFNEIKDLLKEEMSKQKDLRTLVETQTKELQEIKTQLKKMGGEK